MPLVSYILSLTPLDRYHDLVKILYNSSIVTPSNIFIFVKRKTIELIVKALNSIIDILHSHELRLQKVNINEFLTLLIDLYNKHIHNIKCLQHPLSFSVMQK